MLDDVIWKEVKKMTLEEFKELITNLKVKIKFNPNRNFDGELDIIGIKWSPGGVSGGSCWETSDPQYYEGDEKPEFKDLDIILEQVCPNISFLQYKLLTQNLIRTEKYSDEEWYGNRTDYCSNYIVVDEFYNYLLERNLL